MAENLLQDLFGTDSDEEQPQEAPAAPEARDEGAAGPSADPYGIEGRGKTDVLAAAGLLDSDDEGADGDAKGAGKEEGGQEEGEEEGGKRRRARRDGILTDEPGEYEAPLHPNPDPRSLSLARLGKNVGLEVLPFRPDDYEEDVPGGEGRTADYLARIRWRAAGPVGDPGAMDEGGRRALQATLQGNARLVTWSDGSIQLLIGEEAFDVQAVDTAQDHSYLFAQHRTATALTMQGQAHLLRSLQFRPASERTVATALQIAAGKKRRKVVASARHFMPTLDPEKQKELELKQAMDDIKAEERVAKRKERKLQGGGARGGGGGGGYRRGGGLKDFLEANDNLNYMGGGSEDKYEDDEEDEDLDERGRKKKALDRIRRNVDDAGEERIMEAKRAATKRARPEREESHSEEEGGAAEISDVSEGEEEEDEEDENLAKRRKGVLAFSDDDE